MRIDEKILNRFDELLSRAEGDVNFGPDSALYAGFGYIRESEKKKGGRRKSVQKP